MDKTMKAIPLLYLGLSLNVDTIIRACVNVETKEIIPFIGESVFNWTNRAEGVVDNVILSSQGAISSAFPPTFVANKIFIVHPSVASD